MSTNKEFQEEIKGIIREGIAQGLVEAKAAERKERDKFHSTVGEIARNSRIIKRK